MQRGFGNTLSILVVEDDEAVAELLRTVLNDVVGWGATVVHDASAAREVFRHVRIEILVIDVNLPGISGIELLSLLRQDPHWNEPPIMLMSADAGQTAVTDAIRAGWITTFLHKPFEVEQLVEAVRAAVENAYSGSNSDSGSHTDVDGDRPDT